ncbi:MAG TPA: hypothetical protein VFW38_03405 [Solirubrobacteraceae bacterium]|nr:hypothetical protein [Solirubrobacteraceae bacterium]
MSASFRFSLERVRALRERAESDAQVELVGAIARLADGEEGLRAADLELESAREQQRAAAVVPSATAAVELRDRQAYLERSEANRRASEDERDRLAEVASERGAELERASRDHQMLQRLRERRLLEHQRELAREEAVALDEIAVTRAHRSML